MMILWFRMTCKFFILCILMFILTNSIEAISAKEDFYVTKEVEWRILLEEFDQNEVQFPLDDIVENNTETYIEVIFHTYIYGEEYYQDNELRYRYDIEVHVECGGEFKTKAFKYDSDKQREFSGVTDLKDDTLYFNPFLFDRNKCTYLNLGAQRVFGFLLNNDEVFVTIRYLQPL